MPKVIPEYKEQATKRILDAAVAEFATKGYRMTTMNDIADRVGVSKAAVYQYFQNKEALVGAVATSLVEDLLKREFFSASDMDLFEATKGAFERIVGGMPNWFPNLIGDFLSEAHRDKNARDQVREIDQKLVEAISAFWEDRKRAGEIPSDVDTESVSRGLVAFFVGLMAFVSTGLPRSEAVDAWTAVVGCMESSLGQKRQLRKRRPSSGES